MSVATKCIVEVFCSKNELLAFDFGFAGIIFCNADAPKKLPGVYLREGYSEEFVEFWYCHAMPQADKICSIEVDPQTFDCVKNILSTTMLSQRGCNKLRALLRKTFPSYFEQYSG